MNNTKQISIREVLLVAALLAALYGGFEGIHKIAANEAKGVVNEHVIAVEPKFKEIQQEQNIMKEQLGRIDERTTSTKEAIDRIEKKLPN